MNTSPPSTDLRTPHPFQTIAEGLALIAGALSAADRRRKRDRLNAAIQRQLDYGRGEG